MKIENQVCSLEQAKKLKELSIEQKSLFTHCVVCPDPLGEKYFYGVFYEYDHSPESENAEVLASAFTVAELGVMLPDSWEVVSKKENHRSKYSYGVWQYEDREGDRIYRYRHIDMITDMQDNPPTFDTEAQCRASLLIYLLENKLTTPEEVNKRLAA